MFLRNVSVLLRSDKSVLNVVFARWEKMISVDLMILFICLRCCLIGEVGFLFESVSVYCVGRVSIMFSCGRMEFVDCVF